MKRTRKVIKISTLALKNQIASEKIQEMMSPQMKDEVSMVGSMPDLASDDDLLDIEHSLGLSLDTDEEHPKPLDIAGDIDKAEEYNRTH